MELQRQRGVRQRTPEYWDLRGKLIVSCIMFRKGQRWRNGSYVSSCSALHDPDLRVSCDGWTAGGELLEIKASGTLVFYALNVNNFNRFIGIQMEPWISESINWADWIKCALGGPLPQGWEDNAVAWGQYQQALVSRISQRPRTLNQRLQEVVTVFPCDIIADEPCLLDDLDFI
jgi:hypothetical protein